MCRTMNELEKAVADYRSLKALKEDLEEQLKDIERETSVIWIARKNLQKPAKTSQLNYPLANAVQSIQNDLKQILDHWQNTSESASTDDYM